MIWLLPWLVVLVGADLGLEADASVKLSILLEPHGAVEIPQDFRVYLREAGKGEAEFPMAKAKVLPLAVEVPRQVLRFDAGTVSCRGDGVWCPELKMDPDITQVVLPVYRSTRFRVVAEAPEDPPREVLVQGWLQGGEGSVLSFRQLVRAEGPSLDFQGPRGLLDFRLAAAGRQSIYLWDVQARGPTQSLGSHRWIDGSSICGFGIDDESGRVVAEGVVRLALSGRAEQPPSSRDAQRRKRLERATATNSRGFFQISGVEPGVYRLEIETEGKERRLAVLDPIRIAEDSEHCFSEVRLSRSSTVTVEVLPARDPVDRPWGIVALTPGEDVTLEQGENGRYQATLPRGRYRLMIRDSQGVRVDIREVDIDRSEVWLELPLDLVPIAGRLLFRGEAWSAEIRVLAGHGDEHPFETDEEGRFQGWIRRPSYPMVTFLVRPRTHPTNEHRLEVRGFDPEAETLEFLLEGGGGSIAGLVLGSDGLPAPEALVSALREGGGQVRGSTDEEGRFELRGVEEGVWTVSASWLDVAWTEERKISVRDSQQPEEVSLRLEETRQVEGRILLSTGEAVPGARVGLRVPPPVPAAVGARTDVQGKFSLKVPAGASVGVLSVSGPVLWSGCVSLSPSEASTPWVVRLPLEGGTAALHLRDRSGELTAWRGFSALLTADGGFLTLSHLAAWSSRQGEPFKVSGGDGEEDFVVSGLAPGPYALHHSLEPETSLAAATCSGLTPQAPWAVVSPGGTTTFEEAAGPSGESFLSGP